jgi:hypothetical protein
MKRTAAQFAMLDHIRKKEQVSRVSLGLLEMQSEWNPPLSQPLTEALGNGAPTISLNLR